MRLVILNEMHKLEKGAVEQVNSTLEAMVFPRGVLLTILCVNTCVKGVYK